MQIVPCHEPPVPQGTSCLGLITQPFLLYCDTINSNFLHTCTHTSNMSSGVYMSVLMKSLRDYSSAVVLRQFFPQGTFGNECLETFSLSQHCGRGRVLASSGQGLGAVLQVLQCTKKVDSQDRNDVVPMPTVQRLRNSVVVDLILQESGIRF